MTIATSLRQESFTTAALDVEKLRRDFPILEQKVHGHDLVYLDNAATTQKPKLVLEMLDHYYRTTNANVHRGVHLLSEQATYEFEKARGKVQNFIHAKEFKEIIFTRGTTEAINLVTQSYGRSHFKAGDEIIISAMEHHSNIVPWQMLCEQTGAVLRVIPINDRGELLMDEFEKLLNAKTKFVSIVHVSNALGTINPVREIIQKAHAVGALVLVDGAQAVAHTRVDVQALDCDFYAFSGHKIFGPTGIGVLYGKAKLLEAMPPYQGGGDMISKVSFEKSTYNVLPYKFEAGTPHIAGAVGLGAALDYVYHVGIEKIEAYEHELLNYGAEALLTVPGLRLIGTAERKASVLSFVLDDIHPHDIGTILNQEGIAIRTGHHCAMPVMQCFKVPATARASLAFYNKPAEIDRLVQGLAKVRKVLG